MTRAEHLEWCKKRALAYLPQNPGEALASMMSDLRKHDELENHIGIELGMMEAMLPGGLQSERIRHWIEGFN